MPDPESLQQVLLRELAAVFEPVASAGSAAADGNTEAVVLLFESMDLGEDSFGDAFEVVVEVTTDVGESWSTIESSFENDELPPVSELDDIAGAIGKMISSIGRLDDITVPEGDVEDLPTRVLDYLLIRYLRIEHPRVHDLLALVGVIEEGYPGRIDFGALPDALDDPGGAAAELFGWGTEEFQAYAVLTYLHGILLESGVMASLGEPSPDVAALAEARTTANDRPVSEEQDLRIPLFHDVSESGIASLSLVILPLPPREGGLLPGVALVPIGNVRLNETIELSDTVTFDGSFDADQANWGLTVRPTPDGSIEATLEAIGENTTPPTSVHGEATVSVDPSADTAERTLIGNPSGSRLALSQLSARVTVDATADDFALSFELPASGTIGVHPADMDGFLSEVLPADGIFHDFETTIGWSSKTGLYFERGGTLEASLPVGERIGPALIEEVYLSIGTPDTDSEAQPNASPASMHIVGAASASIELGPIVGTVKRIGVSADVSFPENADGNLGPIDLDMGFEPPDGIGLVVDAGGVTGGGYLEFDHENERYAGTLQLQIGDLVLSAVGLLTTRLPDGSSGFSLLVIIAGEFTPIQLGLGFTLNGVGGLLGINRSFRAEPLGEAVREGSLDSVLFPVDPVANAQRIISDLRAIFPPTRDLHVFGPMAKLGYGTPAMVTADLAVLLEIPSFKIAVLGRLRARLPDEEAPLVILNMDVAGVLDPPGQRASIDASLFDSRIGAYTVSGDMALRTSWGENPRFVLSVGGFHPRFKPPADFPALRRVRVGIGEPGGNPSIDLNGYLALTSNTAQVGAGAHVRAEAGPAKVEAKLAFDALFQFDPFQFVIDFLVDVAVRVFGEGFSVRVDGTLSGTAPWRVRGRISIDLWLIEVNESIDLTFGEAETHTPLPAARILPLLTESVSNPSNWTAQLPPRGRTAVTLRRVKAAPDEVLVHPLGRLGVRQTVVPLEYPIETFRRATPGDFTRFTIETVELGGTGGGLELGERTKEQFAPAQFLKLTDDQKLDSPAFERLEAGRRMSTDGLGADVSGGPQRALLTYETTVIDREEAVYGRRFRHLGAADIMLVGQAWQTTEARFEVSAVAMTRVRAFAPASTAPLAATVSEGESEAAKSSTGSTSPIDARTGMLTGAIRLTEETYAIAEARTMTAVDPATMQPITVEAAERNAMPKSEAKRTLARYETAHPGDSGLYQVVALSRLRSAAAARPE